MILFGASGHAKVILDIINSGTGDTVDYILDYNSEQSYNAFISSPIVQDV